jgi:hypothetical protein
MYRRFSVHGSQFTVVQNIKLLTDNRELLSNITGITNPLQEEKKGIKKEFSADL